MAKTEHVQIRVTRAEKAELVRRARAAGQDLSSFLLKRALPDTAGRFAALVQALVGRARDPFVLAELSDFLGSLDRSSFDSALELLPRARLDDVTRNLMCAMVETRAAKLAVRPPAWAQSEPALRRPWFPTELSSVRLHLLCNSPPAFRRRNLFVDSTVGDRV
jgi:hypothetical protein